MDTKKNHKLAGLWLLLIFIPLILGFVYIGLFVNDVVGNKAEIDAYLDELGVFREDLRITTSDGNHISATLFVNKSIFPNNTAESPDLPGSGKIPTVLFIPGANSLKYRHLDKYLLLVNEGYAVISIDKRAHGESGGYYSMYTDEPLELSSIIDYLGRRYAFLNTSATAAIGMSLGGGEVLHLQAIDPRVYITVAYHPLANISDLWKQYGFNAADFIGFTPAIRPADDMVPDFRSMDEWHDLIEEIWYNRSAINVMTPENTENLLIIHGLNDDIITPNASEQVIRKVDPSMNRDDIKLVRRPGLGHGGNERDYTSFKYTIAWLDHFYKNSSIDLTNLDGEIEYVSFPEKIINLPQRDGSSPNLTFGIAAFSLTIIFTGARLSYYRSYRRSDTRKKGKKDPAVSGKQYESPSISKSDGTVSSESSAGNIGGEKLRSSGKLIYWRLFILILSYLSAGVIARVFNPSYFYSILIYGPVLAVTITILFPEGPKKPSISLFGLDSSERPEIKDMAGIFLTALSLIAIIFTYLTLYNYMGRNILGPRYRPENSVILRYIAIFAVFLLQPVVIADKIDFKRSPVLIVMFFIAISLFSLFVPIRMEPLVGEIFPFISDGVQLNLFFSLLLALVYYAIYLFFKLVHRFILGSNLSISIVLSSLIAVLINMRFFRLI